MENDIEKEIVVVYHDKCADGFTGAWVAHKKFGDTAQYIATEDRINPPSGLGGKHVYFIDYCYPQETMQEIAKNAKSLVILDHHKTGEAVVKSFDGSVYDVEHSGAYIAWKYFFPNEKVPKLVEYIEDGDLYKFTVTDSRTVLSYIYSLPYDFETFESIAQDLENGDGYQRIYSYGLILENLHTKEVASYIKKAEKVIFEGYTVYIVNAPHTVRNDVGHQLAMMQGPFSITFSYEKGHIKCSLRGDGTVDLSEIAGRYGGGGHKNASAFIVQVESPLPCVKRINE